MDELKENALIVLHDDYYFILSDSKKGIASIEKSPYSIYGTSTSTSKSLILLKNLPVTSPYIISVWLCFCSGNVITYQVMKSDLCKLSIYDYAF